MKMSQIARGREILKKTIKKLIKKDIKLTI